MLYILLITRKLKKKKEINFDESKIIYFVSQCCYINIFHFYTDDKMLIKFNTSIRNVNEAWKKQGR